MGFPWLAVCYWIHTHTYNLASFTYLQLRKNSKATQAGLAEGDVVTVIDHQNVASKSHGDAMKIIELAGPTLRLEIIK